MNEIGLIFGMMLLTFTPRYLPFALAGRFQLPPFVLKALEFVPIAVLCAIITQVAVFHDGVAVLNFSNAYLVAAIVAFLVSLFSKKMFLTILAGLISYGLAVWLG